MFLQRDNQTDPEAIAKLYLADELREELKKFDPKMKFPEDRTLTGARRATVPLMAQRLSELRLEKQKATTDSLK